MACSRVLTESFRWARHNASRCFRSDRDAGQATSVNFSSGKKRFWNFERSQPSGSQCSLTLSDTFEGSMTGEAPSSCVLSTYSSASASQIAVSVSSQSTLASETRGAHRVSGSATMAKVRSTPSKGAYKGGCVTGAWSSAFNNSSTWKCAGNRGVGSLIGRSGMPQLFRRSCFVSMANEYHHR